VNSSTKLAEATGAMFLASVQQRSTANISTVDTVRCQQAAGRRPSRTSATVPPLQRAVLESARERLTRSRPIMEIGRESCVSGVRSMRVLGSGSGRPERTPASISWHAPYVCAERSQRPAPGLPALIVDRYPRIGGFPLTIIHFPVTVRRQSPLHLGIGGSSPCTQ
jgi:hypothetical protein